MTTSFRKATRGKVPDIIGTRISVENSQLLISTGAPDFDSVIGGGLAVGSLILIAEDPNGSYAKLLAKLFLAEGVAVGHPILMASQDLDAEKLIKELPPTISATDITSSKSNNKPRDDAELKIAWRYQNLPTGGKESPGVNFGHYFDLSKTISPETIEAVQPKVWNGCDQGIVNSGPFLPSFASLLAQIRQTITEKNCWVSGSDKVGNDLPKTVLRIVIHSLGSPLWGKDCNQLTSFMYVLRSLIRSACAVIFISVPASILKEEVLSQCVHLSDYSVQLMPAQHIDGKVPPLLSGMDGVFKILHLGAINSLMPFKPATLDLGFKVRRKKFCVEKLQLPPELTESVEREQDDIGVPSLGSVGCGTSMGNKKLDF